MSKFEQKDNTGSIFANDRKETANHPDGRGSAIIGGVEYWISSWNKKTQEGKSWRSLSFTAKNPEAPAKAPSRPQEPQSRRPSHDGAKARQLPPQDEFDSDVPF